MTQRSIQPEHYKDWTLGLVLSDLSGIGGAV